MVQVNIPLKDGLSAKMCCKICVNSGLPCMSNTCFHLLAFFTDTVALCKSCILCGLQACDFFEHCDTEITQAVVCANWSEAFLSVPNWLIYGLYQKTMVKSLLAFMEEKEFVLHSFENPALMLSLLPLATYINAKICWLVSVRVMYKQSRAKLAVTPIKVSQTLGKITETSVPLQTFY